MSELRSEEEARSRSAYRVWRGLQLHRRFCTAPRLILKCVPIDADRIVKLGKKRARQRLETSSRPLMDHEPLPIDLEFVALRLAAKDRVIVNHQTGLCRTGLALKEKSCCQAADTASDNDAVKG